MGSSPAWPPPPLTAAVHCPAGGRGGRRCGGFSPRPTPFPRPPPRTLLLKQFVQLQLPGSQYWPDAKHSQYNFKHREFLQLHCLSFRGTSPANPQHTQGCGNGVTRSGGVGAAAAGGRPTTPYLHRGRTLGWAGARQRFPARRRRGHNNTQNGMRDREQDRARQGGTRPTLHGQSNSNTAATVQTGLPSVPPPHKQSRTNSYGRGHAHAIAHTHRHAQCWRSPPPHTHTREIGHKTWIFDIATNGRMRET